MSGGYLLEAAFPDNIERKVAFELYKKLFPHLEVVIHSRIRPTYDHDFEKVGKEQPVGHGGLQGGPHLSKTKGPQWFDEYENYVVITIFTV